MVGTTCDRISLLLSEARFYCRWQISCRETQACQQDLTGCAPGKRIGGTVT
jgi:hypothetical protein